MLAIKLIIVIINLKAKILVNLCHFINLKQYSLFAISYANLLAISLKKIIVQKSQNKKADIKLC